MMRLPTFWHMASFKCKEIFRTREIFRTSLWDGKEGANTERFQGSVSLFRGGGKNAIRIFSHFPHFFSHFLGRSLSVMFKRIHSSGIV